MPQSGRARNRGQSLRKTASSRSGRRVRKYKAPKPTLFRRVLRLIFNPITFAVVAFSLLGIFLVASYYWFEFSDKINRMLAGDVFTRNAGIYSAPKTLRKGEAITDDELVDYLLSAGYAANNSADPLRSKYKAEGNKVTIEPGVTAVLDGKVEFRTIDVLFDKKGEKVEKITDKKSGDELAKTALEPKLLSAVAREGDGQRKVVTFKDLPPHLIKAITVTEDRGFFDHYGVNFRGIARALWARYDGEDSNAPIENQGGSSITQQLVKNLFLTPERTWERKAREAYMSVILETRLTKEEIFELYANQIYLGQDNGVSIYGVGEASTVYFGKDVSALTLPEAAFIAGIIRSPNRYQPSREPGKARERRNQVIQSMLEAGEISASRAKAAKDTDLSVVKPAARVDQQGMEYFAQYAVEQLPTVVDDPEALQHLRVFTSIDPDLQKIAHGALTKQLSKLEKYYKDEDKKKNLNGALVAIRPKTGEIVAMIGGKDYADNQFNRAADAMRQPGSVFKPFVYASAINTAYLPNSRVLTAASVFKDEKKVFTFNQDSYSPGNYGDYFSNKEMTLRDALVKSKNVITVDIAMELNVGTVMNLARKAGLPKVERAYPSMALGTAEATPLQMAEAYTMFANLGDVVEPIAINKIATGEGRTISNPVGQKRSVLRPDVSYVLVDMMKDVVNRGTAAGLSAWGFRNEKGKKGFAGKTGTSRDGWFVGFTPEILVAVYVGFDDGSDLRIDGSDSAMPIWAEFMKEALSLHPEWNGDWSEPGGIRKAEIDIRTGALIRELGPDGEAVEPTPTPTPAFPVDPDLANTLPPDTTPEVYVTDVPNEFKRVELFIGGTLPNRMLKEDLDSEYPDGIDPNASPTPFTTWEQAEEDVEPEPARGQPQTVAGEVPVVLCPLSGKRATANCPEKKVKKFKVGTEPTEFCDFHVGKKDGR